MSGITSVVEPVFSGIGDSLDGGGGGSGIAKGILSDGDLFQQQSQREAQAKANADAREAELTDAANQQIALRDQNLQKGLSHAKAFFAAQGIDPNSGSPYALANADTANTNELNDYTQTQLNNNINDINRNLSDLQSNDLLSRTQKDASQLLDSFF